MLKHLGSQKPVKLLLFDSASFYFGAGAVALLPEGSSIYGLEENPALCLMALRGIQQLRGKKELASKQVLVPVLHSYPELWSADMLFDQGLKRSMSTFIDILMKPGCKVKLYLSYFTPECMTKYGADGRLTLIEEVS
jgi:hypothetical protein